MDIGINIFMSPNKFEDIMAAITFAEAGEQEKARDFLKGRKTILLAISDMMFDKNILKYAMSISKRIEAAIDVLYLTKADVNNNELKTFISEANKEGIGCNVVKKEGCMKKAILEYTEKRREILFVIVGSTPELEIECKTGEKTLTDAWRKLKCPLVVVSKGELPSMA
jgi:K+-sensing histidine kinase KdpD